MGFLNSIIKDVVAAPVTIVTETTKAVITAPTKIIDAVEDGMDEATKDRS